VQGGGAIDCGTDHNGVRGIVSAGSVSVYAGGNAMCTTTDGGASWTKHELGEGLHTNPVWNGKSFVVWGNNSQGALSRFTSTDGLQWNATPVKSQVSLSAVGTTVDGKFVATNPDWNGGYENQRFYRSDDGVTWETLAASAFAPGHPIKRFRAGIVDANQYCPGK
jgi:hypothetical protein